MSAPRRKIAIFYYIIVKDNAIGMVDRTILEHLCEKYDFTVFAARFDNPRPERIRWIRIPCVSSPVLLVILLFRLSAFAVYFWHCFINREKFDIVQSSDGSFGHADIADAHFCNRFYLLRVMERKVNGLRSAAALAARLVSSFLERRVYRNAGIVVTPSQGLRRELIQTHDVDPDRIVVVPLPIDTNISPPNPNDRAALRLEMGLSESDPVFVFAALGDFERKGLGPLIDALADSRLLHAKLLVVGGSPGSLAPYTERARYRNVQNRVIFCGKHPSIRSFLWAADAFVLPSKYETFSVVTMQAALSALPLITTRLSGVEEYARDGVTGFIIDACAAESIADSLARFLLMSNSARQEMGCQAFSAVSRFGIDRFIKSWDQIYSGFQRNAA